MGLLIDFKLQAMKHCIYVCDIKMWWKVMNMCVHLMLEEFSGRRLQWTRGLRHVLSSTARNLELWG